MQKYWLFNFLREKNTHSQNLLGKKKYILPNPEYNSLKLDDVYKTNMMIKTAYILYEQLHSDFSLILPPKRSKNDVQKYGTVNFKYIIWSIISILENYFFTKSNILKNEKKKGEIS